MLGVARHTMSNALFICWFFLLVFAGCERKIARVEPVDSAPTPSNMLGPAPTNFIEWEQRAKHIHVGMRREDAEHLLQHDSRHYGLLIGAMGVGQCVTYVVSDDVTVNICYDYTGIERDTSGIAHYSPYSHSADNRVTRAASVQHKN